MWRQRRKVQAAYDRDERRRQAADRRVRDAIRARALEVLKPLDDALLAKLKDLVPPKEFETLSHALVHNRICAKAYEVAPDAAIRWAASRRDWFPRFLFRKKDVAVVDARATTAPSDSTTAPRIDRVTAPESAASAVPAPLKLGQLSPLAPPEPTVTPAQFLNSMETTRRPSADSAAPQFRARATWLREELERQRMTVTQLHTQGGPDTDTPI